MGVIRKLSDDLINKIAAGEVVERPASVIKELVDNAVDSGARRIVIHVENGGVAKMLVQDDGSGMDRDDVRASVLRHGTSKIASIDELMRVGTMGFRGEALASIGAVSRLTIRSKQEDDVSGNELLMEEGNVVKEKKIGMSRGTVVIVEDLFENVPVRKKFLKSPSTEMRHIVEIVNRIALGNYAVSFVLSHNGREVVSYDAERDAYGRVLDVLGGGLGSKLVEVMYDHPHLQVKGWVGKPEVGLERGVKQYLLVNRRSVSDKTVAGAVKQAMGSLVMPRVQVPWVIYVSLPQEMVDVNVHPRKEEVRWVNSSSVFKAIKAAVEAGMQRDDLRPVISNANDIVEDSRSVSTFDVGYRKISYELGGAVRSVRSEVVRDGRSNYGKEVSRNTVPGMQKDIWADVSLRGLPWEKDVSEVLSVSSEIVQLNNLYLVTEVKSGMRIVDQHAAHERVRFEALVNEFKSRDKHQQQMLVAEEVELSVEEAEIVSESLDVFEALGFEVEIQKSKKALEQESSGKEVLGDSAGIASSRAARDPGKDVTVLVVRAVPMLLSKVKVGKLIREVLGDLMGREDGEEMLANIKGVEGIDDQSLRLLTYMACRSAVKAGDFIPREERVRLLENLAECQIPYSCPHGRPVEVLVAGSEMEKWFKRVV